MSIDPAKLDAIENTIVRLSRELAEVRRALAAAREESAGAHPTAAAAASSAAPPAAPPAAPLAAPLAPAARNGGMENLIGRYGALVLAVLTIMMGAGALVSWAITHGLLGPETRVALGALLAIVTAVVGFWLRARGSRELGNAVVALSLAIVHVVAWGAGPRLGIVPAWASLIVADVASVALAVLALVEEEEVLYATGLGGALISPFVMSTGSHRVDLLAGYGVVVLATAIGIIRKRAWWKAIGLVIVGTVIYTASVTTYRGDIAWINREFAAGFAGFICITALLWEREPSRPWISLSAVTVMSFVTSRALVHGGTPLVSLMTAPDVQIVALVGTALLFEAVRDAGTEDLSAAWAFPVLVVPLIFLSSALGGVGEVGGPVSGSIVLAWALAYGLATLRESGIRRGILLMLAGLAGVWAITLLLDHSPTALPIVLAAYAVLIAVVVKSEAQPVALAASGAALVVAFANVWIRLTADAGYVTPFMSNASIAAAAVVSATYLSLQIGLPEKIGSPHAEMDRGYVAVFVACAVAFAWGDLELRRAFSADVSTFLLIAYYALCGVVAIGQGRVRKSPRLRQVGLGLAVLAALYAIVAASGVQQIGLRVGSYLLVGAFLLGVAWWYRGDEATSAT